MGKWQKAPEELKERFERAISRFREIQPRKMFGYPCAFLNGHMFTGLHESNWVLRLPPEGREALEKAGGKPFSPMEGRVMKEYVTLPDTIQKDGDLLEEWLTKSIEFVSSLAPKEKKKRKT